MSTKIKKILNFFNFLILFKDNGAILDAETCKLSPESVLGYFANGVKNLAALSLESG